MSSSSISHFSSSSSCFFVFFGGGGRGGGGGGVRRFGCSGAICRSSDFDDLRYGEWMGLAGEPVMELTLRKSSDMGVFLGMTEEEREIDEGGTVEVRGAGVLGGGLLLADVDGDPGESSPAEFSYSRTLALTKPQRRR